LHVIVSVLVRADESGPSPDNTTSATRVSDHRLGGVAGRSQDSARTRYGRSGRSGAVGASSSMRIFETIPTGVA
jgi:hypothetical protein